MSEGNLMIHPILFIILAAVAVLAALGMLLSRNAVHSALYLVLNFITIAVFFLVLNAPFLAMVQITVYAGAIVVLFLFVIMLLGADKLRGATEDVRGGERFHQVAAVLLAITLLGVFIFLLVQGDGGEAQRTIFDGGPRALGRMLFSTYIFPFEITGVLLLAAIAGVVIFGRSRSRGESDG